VSSAQPPSPSSGHLVAKRKSVLIHCQYVYGIGHFVRAVELARSFSRYFNVHLVSGGEPVPNFSLPDGVRFTQLPAIFKNETSPHLIPVDRTTSLGDCFGLRAHMLAKLVRACPPDILVTEHFPFGLLFETEALALIAQVRSARLGALVISSVRDVIESEYGSSMDVHVCELLNRFFDLVMVHGDERVVALRASFPLIDRVLIPVVHTGYVVGRPEELRPRVGPPLLLAAIGGGRIGQELLSALAEAHLKLVPHWWHELVLFRGAFGQVGDLPIIDTDSLRVRDFDRAAYRQLLAEATGVICLGGYNSVLEALSMSLPTLVYKRIFMGMNREQALRAELFAASGLVDTFDESDLAVDKLAPRLLAHFASRPIDAVAELNFNGADNACQILLAASENLQPREGNQAR
jgi:predicted glycosyltransferase